MTDDNGKITLESEQFSKFLDLIAQGGNSTPIRAISAETEKHAVDGVEAQKAWFRQTAVTVEKLSERVDKLRDVELVELKKELKREIEKLEKQVTKNEDALTKYKTDIIKPLNDKLIGLDIRLGIYTLIASAIGGGLVAYFVWILKLGHSAATGSPPPPTP